MVDDVQQAKDAVTYAKYPPLGKRSRGGGQYGFWSRNYRETANDNMMVVVMIESPAASTSSIRWRRWRAWTWSSPQAAI